MKALNRKRRRQQRAAISRIMGVDRTPAGHISRSARAMAQRRRNDEILSRREMDENLGVVLDARKRLYGAKDGDVNKFGDRTDATSPYWHDAFGRLYMRGKIDTDQWLAGNTARDIVEDMRKAIAAPAKGHVGGIDGGEQDPSYVEWCRAAISRHREMERCIKDLCFAEGSRQPRRVLNLVLWNEHTLPTGDLHDERAIGDLRTALNAIHRWALSGRRSK